MGAEIFTNINFKDGLKKKKTLFFIHLQARAVICLQYLAKISIIKEK